MTTYDIPADLRNAAESAFTFTGKQPNLAPAHNNISDMLERGVEYTGPISLRNLIILDDGTMKATDDAIRRAATESNPEYKAFAHTQITGKEYRPIAETSPATYREHVIHGLNVTLTLGQFDRLASIPDDADVSYPVTINNVQVTPS